MVIFQVVIPAAGVVNITDRVNGSTLPANVAPNTFIQALTIQNNSGNPIRVGDTTVSATKGIVIAAGAPGGAFSESAFMNYGSYLSDWNIAGTPGDTIDCLYIP